MRPVDWVLSADRTANECTKLLSEICSGFPIVGKAASARERKNNSTQTWHWIVGLSFFKNLILTARKLTGFVSHGMLRTHFTKKINPQYILTIQPENPHLTTRLFTVACKHTVQGVCVLDSASPQFNSDLCALWYIIRSHVLTRLLPCQCNCRVFPEVPCHQVYRAAVAVAANMTLWDYSNCWMENILKH